MLEREVVATASHIAEDGVSIRVLMQWEGGVRL